jgi:uncharacterized damage-inducible protein DinB
MRHEVLIENYLAGPEILRRSVSGMSDEQINASPIQYKWSTREVVLHISDFDLIYADHMKRVIAESEPSLQDGDRKLFAARLAYDKRDVDEEIRMIKAVRRHMGRILRSLNADAFERKGIHSEHGPVTLADLLQRAVDHIPHHALYIEEKRKALQVGERAIPFHLASVGVG